MSGRTEYPQVPPSPPLSTDIHKELWTAARRVRQEAERACGRDMPGAEEIFCRLLERGIIEIGPRCGGGADF